MLSRLFSLFTTQTSSPAPFPLPMTITGIRFPADGSAPHHLPLTTTTDGVKDSSAAPWGHIPDLRAFWRTPQAWAWRDFETFRLVNQRPSTCNGLYVVFYSFDSESLLVHSNFPVGVFGRERTFAGDVFVVKLQGREIGEDLGEDGWGVWEDVPGQVLGLEVMRM
ncbi:hypothetical protein GE09DRAFT_751216 [Coniochaeta sp. 2T2.1]|nr:hypothetical protein GE09DRAFT_751216 [Coniochaeta sp. 2T2.1]